MRCTDILVSLRRRIEMLEQEGKALGEQLERDSKQSRGHEVALLTGIPGIGTRTACRLLAELGDVHRFANACKLVAFAGLAPARFESGTGVGGVTAISRLGSSSLRRVLYMPSMAAIRCYPIVKAFYEKLVDRRKPGKAAVIACMARLLKIAYGVLASGIPFAANPVPA